MNDFLQAPAIEPLPAAPLWERFLLEQPLLPAIVLLLIAIVAAVAFAGKGQRRRGLVVGGVLAIVAGVVFLTATLVTTTRETLLDRTEALIGATARADAATLRGMLTEDAALNTSGDIRRVLPPIDEVGVILDQAERYLQGQYRVQQWTIHDRQATLDGPNVARTLIRVGVDVNGLSRTHFSWWRLHWTRGPDGQWRCFELEPLWIQFVGSA